MKKRSALFVLSLSVGLLWWTAARAEVQVLPSRIFLSDSQKTAQISIVLKGGKPATFRINAVALRMSENGVMTEVKDPTQAELSAVEDFRFSPRRLTVDPGLEQVVRLQMKTSEEAANVEYRSLLTIEPVDGDSGTPKEGSTIQVPVFVKHGNPELKVSLEKLKTFRAKDGSLNYSVEILKTGSAVLVGDLVVTHLAEEAAKPEIVAQTNGVLSVNERRVVTQTLTVPAVPKGKLTAELRESVSEGAKVLATVSIETEPLPSLPIPSRGPSALP